MPADDSLREPNWLADAPAAAADDSRSTDALAAEIQTLEEMIRQPAAGPTYSDDDECRRIVRLVEQIGKPATTGSTEVGSSVDNGPRERIGHYELLVKLGEGGMGAVYKARHTRLDKLVALKVLPADRLGDAQAVARFEREMQAVGRLSHPNIVAAHDAGDADGRHYLVMELVEGTDLSTIVRRCGPLPIAEACEVIRATAEGLQHAHGFGMVHRDIKPGNLMLTHEGRVKILDMGLALLDAMKNAGKAELTTTGQLMGTIDYMAPEQGNNSHTVDIRADVYSLGATLFKLLTGEAPFHGPKYDSPISKLAALAVETPRRLGDVRADVPAELSDLVAHMLAKQPDGRPATPHEIVERLAPWAAGARLDEVARIAKETTDRPADGADSATFAHLRSSFTGTHPSIAPRVAVAPSGPIRRRPRGPVIAAAAGAAALVLFGIWFIIRDKDGNEIARVEVPSGGSAEVQTGSAPLAPVLRGEGPGVRGSATESRPTIAPPSPTPTAVASSVPKTPAVLAPVATKTPDSSQSLVGLVPRPAKLIGVERWQLETTDPRLAFSSHSLTWNAAGTHLAFIATSGTEHQVRVYEYVAGKLHLRHLLPTNNTATSNAWVSWSPDGKQLAAKLRDTLVIWRLDGRSAAIVAKRLIPGTLHYHAQWSPTEPWLAIVTPQGKVFFWNPGTDELHSLDIPTPKMSQVFCQIAWRPDGTQLALSGGSGNDTIYLVKPLQGVIRSLQLESPFMTASYYRSLSPTAWSPDGSLLTVLLKNDEIQVWDAEQGEKKFAFAGRKGGP